MGYLRYERSTIPQPHKRLSDFNINLAAQETDAKNDFKHNLKLFLLNYFNP